MTCHGANSHSTTWNGPTNFKRLASTDLDRYKSTSTTPFPFIMTTTAGEAVTKRLHIAGLTPAIKPEDLAERFSRYGVVEGVENVGVDGFGQ
jgi:hypothetical protein